MHCSSIQEYQVKGQLMEEQCTQEVNAFCWLAQACALPNGTSRPDGTADHAGTYMGGRCDMNSPVLKGNAK